MSTRSLGRLTLDMVLQTGNFTGPMDRAQRRLKRNAGNMVRELKRIGVGIVTVGAAAAAAAGGGLALMTKAGLENVDAQAKLARQLDSSIGGLRGLQLAASDAGVDTGVLDGAMERLSSRLGEAQLGTGQAAEALERIGLSAAELAAMDVDQRVAAIADRVAELGLSGAETANLLRDLGIRNTEMVNLLRQGGDPIRAARQEIEDYGLAIDGIDAATVEAANDALSRTGLLIESAQNALAVELSPIILEVASRFNEAAREAGGLDSAIQSGVASGLLYIGELADQFNNVRIQILRGDVAMAGLELGVAKSARNSRRFIGEFIESWSSGLNNIIELYNRIPGFGDIETLEFNLDDFLSDVSSNVELALGNFNLRQLELNDALESRPSDVIADFLDSVEEHRQQIADNASQASGLLDDFGGSLEDASGAVADYKKSTDDTDESIKKLGDSALNSSQKIDKAAVGASNGVDPLRQPIGANRAPIGGAEPMDRGPTVIAFEGPVGGRPTWSTDYLDSTIQAATQAPANRGGGDRVPISLTVTGQNGEQASGEGEIERVLVDRLAGVAAAVPGNG